MLMVEKSNSAALAGNRLLYVGPSYGEVKFPRALRITCTFPYIQQDLLLMN